MSCIEVMRMTSLVVCRWSRRPRSSGRRLGTHRRPTQNQITRGRIAIRYVQAK